MRHTQMPATYVNISREEFEGWLDEFTTRNHAVKKWSRSPRHAGVYFLHISPNVAVYVSSSVGSEDSAMGRAQAAIHARLQSTLTDRVLNKKAAEQSRVHRTQNWRDNLAKVVVRLIAAYQKSPKFYEILADEGLDGYVDHWRGVIQKIDGWEGIPRLKELYEQLDQRILSDADEAWIEEYKPEPQDPNENGVAEVEDQKTMVQTFLSSNPHSAFLKSLLDRLMKGSPLTPAQLAALVKMDAVKPDQDMGGRIENLLAKDPDNSFLLSLKRWVQSGRKLTPNQLSALQKMEQARKAPTRDQWLEHLRMLWKQSSNPEVRSVLVDIGKRLKDNAGAQAPTPEDIAVLKSMIPTRAFPKIAHRVLNAYLLRV